MGVRGCKPPPPHATCSLPSKLGTKSTVFASMSASMAAAANGANLHSVYLGCAWVGLGWGGEVGRDARTVAGPELTARMVLVMAGPWCWSWSWSVAVRR